MYEDVRECSRLFEKVCKSSQMLYDVWARVQRVVNIRKTFVNNLKCVRTIINIREHSRTFSNVFNIHKVPRIYAIVIERLEMFANVWRCSQMFATLWESLQMFTNALWYLDTRPKVINIRKFREQFHIGSNVNIHSRTFTNVLKHSQTFSTFTKCREYKRMLVNVWECLGMFVNVCECSRIFEKVCECSQMLHNVWTRVQRVINIQWTLSNMFER